LFFKKQILRVFFYPNTGSRKHARATKHLTRSPNESSPENRVSGLTIYTSTQGPLSPPVKSPACNTVFGVLSGLSRRTAPETLHRSHVTGVLFFKQTKFSVSLCLCGEIANWLKRFSLYFLRVLSG